MKVMGIQGRHVFWIAFSVVAIPCLAFLVLSYIHFQEVSDHIFAEHTQETKAYLSSLTKNTGELPTSEYIARLHLEYDAMWNRQNRTNSALATRTWLRFMTACFGSIVVFIGAIYVLSKIGLSEQTEAEAVAPGVEFSFRSSSPGLVMVLLGASLMVIPHFASQEIGSIDGNIYMHWMDAHPLVETADAAKTPADLYGPFPNPQPDPDSNIQRQGD